MMSSQIPTLVLGGGGGGSGFQLISALGIVLNVMAANI